MDIRGIGHPPLLLKQQCSFLNSCSDHCMNSTSISIAAPVLLDNLPFKETLSRYVPPTYGIHFCSAFINEIW